MKHVYAFAVIAVTILYAGSAMACSGKVASSTKSQILASGSASDISPILLPPVTGSGQ